MKAINFVKSIVRSSCNKIGKFLVDVTTVKPSDKMIHDVKELKFHNNRSIKLLMGLEGDMSEDTVICFKNFRMAGEMFLNEVMNEKALRVAEEAKEEEEDKETPASE